MILKNFILIFLIFIVYIFIGNLLANQVIIPEEAIRFRVLANSNSEDDQKLKKEISSEISKELLTMLKDTNGIDNARNILLSNMDKINMILDKYNVDYKITYGENYFPEKNYKGLIYEEGFYESLLITLGKGDGNNWWCVLFPPLCLLEAKESDDYQYRLYVKELVDKYL